MSSDIDPFDSADEGSNADERTAGNADWNSEEGDRRPSTNAEATVSTADGSEASLSRWTGGSADRSVLNRVTIRRFTECVLDTYGGEVERESNGRWSVTLPDGLAAELGYERATVVFAAEDRTESTDLLVAPGTHAFNALCSFAERPTNARAPSGGDERGVETGSESEPAGIGRLHLSGDVLQFHVPPVLDGADVETTIEEFRSRGEERALAFHFRVQFLSLRSYQREEFVTCAVDPATKTRLPSLAARFASHLPRVLAANGDRDDGTDQSGGNPGFDREAVLGAYSTAKSAAIEKARPTVSALREREETAVADRIAEINEYYDRRRAGIDDGVETKRAEVAALAGKYDRARNDETRLRYLREQREAEDELGTLTARADERNAELRAEERARIEAETERHRVDVDLELVRVTDLSYERGTLSLSVTNGETRTCTTVSYVPATDEHYGLDCACCGTDLTDSTDSDAPLDGPPRLCVGGHLVCAGCAVSCRTCGETRCTACLGESNAIDARRDTASSAGSGERTVSTIEPAEEAETAMAASTVEPFETCALCREAVCGECIRSCASCGERVCADHRETCETGGEVVCLACGEPCAAGGAFHCDAHLLAPTGVSETARYCAEHVVSCTVCGERRAIDAIGRCGECGGALCEDHANGCAVCSETRCERHAVACAHCVETRRRTETGIGTDGGSTERRENEGSIAIFCERHAERCVGGEVVCEAHSRPGVIVDGPVCDDHRADCDLCGVRYAAAGFENGRCPACRGLSAETPAEPAVASIAEEFRSVRIGTTPTHAVIHARKRLRRDEVVVVDRRTGEETNRFTVDFFGGLSGEL